MTHPIIEELIALAKTCAENNIQNNNTLTALQMGGKTYIEKGFSWCGFLYYKIQQRDWRLAKSIGAKKGYKSWTVYFDYSNGQYEDTAKAMRFALAHMQEKYPDNTILKKIYFDGNLD